MISFICLEALSKALNSLLLVLDETISHHGASATCLVLTPTNVIVEVVIEGCHWEDCSSGSTALNAVNPKLDLLVDVSFQGPIGSFGLLVFFVLFVVGRIIGKLEGALTKL